MVSRNSGKFVLMTALALLAFAGNSILTRWGLLDGAMDPGLFALIRLIAGAICLWTLLVLRVQATRPAPTATGSLTLLIYALGFSYAYVTLDTGAGALILFGVVQITLFAWALRCGESVPMMHYVGAVFAFAGLVILFWPQPGTTVPIGGFILMATAGVAWGLYTALGKGAGDATVKTANNFLGAAVCAIPVLVLSSSMMSAKGVSLAIASGAITSGLGYAAWYTVLPHLRSSLAAILQLTVPIIAAVGGIVLFGETLTVPFAVAAVLVIGGTVLAIRG
ncbi:MAG: DMT family transporter [Pseudomonadota bacterium]